jgi:type II secretory pathway pseudopilin PulG
MGATRQKFQPGFTLIELLAIMGITILLAASLLPAVTRAGAKSKAICCNCNLKQVGLSVRIWANDHADQYPMHVSTNQGGTKEFVPGGNAFRHFQALSNELSIPKILVCPSDPARKVAADFFTLSNSNLSYFVSLDAKEEYPQMFLAGDRFIGTRGTVSQNILPLATNSAVFWTARIHHTVLGNIALSDGSVQQLNASTLQKSLLTQGVLTNRLAIP